MSKKPFLNIKRSWQSNPSKPARQTERLQHERGRSSSNMKARLHLPALSCIYVKLHHHFTAMDRRRFPGTTNRKTPTPTGTFLLGALGDVRLCTDTYFIYCLSTAVSGLACA